MSKYLVFFYLLISSFMYSQQMFFKYAFSTSKKDTAIYNLKVVENQSVFYKEQDAFMNEVMELDSCNIFRIEKQQIHAAININDVVEKTNINIDLALSYKWEVKKDKDKIQDLTVQKAITIIENQKWTVWFTEDIPISDGPFVLRGLPGLIVKAEDEKGNQFNLIHISNKNVQDLFCKRQTGAKKLTFDQYKKVINNTEIIQKQLLNKLSNLPGIKGSVNTSRFNPDYNPVKNLIIDLSNTSN